MNRWQVRATIYVYAKDATEAKEKAGAVFTQTFQYKPTDQYPITAQITSAKPETITKKGSR